MIIEVQHSDYGKTSESRLSLILNRGAPIEDSSATKACLGEHADVSRP